MGVGKSTIGKKLAARLGADFIDCDQELERRNGVSVNIIFEIEGEEGFRVRETRLLRELVEGDVGVIATGGGVVTQAENRALLQSAGEVIYLRGSLDLLWSRLRFCKNRPLLQRENPKEVLSDLLNAREPLYQEVATHIVNVGRGSAVNTVRKIEGLLQAEGVVEPET